MELYLGNSLEEITKSSQTEDRILTSIDYIKTLRDKLKDKYDEQKDLQLEINGLEDEIIDEKEILSDLIESL